MTAFSKFSRCPTTSPSPSTATLSSLRRSWTTTATRSLVRNWRSSKHFSSSCQRFLSGDHAKTLRKQRFTDTEKRNCLEAIKIVAGLVWMGEANFAFRMISIVNTLLLRVSGEAVLVRVGLVAPVERRGQLGRPQHHPSQLPPRQQDQDQPVRLHQGGARRIGPASRLDQHGRHQGLQRLWPQVGLLNLCRIDFDFITTTGPRELCGATTRTCQSGWPTSQATTPLRWLSWAGSSTSPPRWPASPSVPWWKLPLEERSPSQGTPSPTTCRTWRPSPTPCWFVSTGTGPSMPSSRRCTSSSRGWRCSSTTEGPARWRWRRRRWRRRRRSFFSASLIEIVKAIFTHEIKMLILICWKSSLAFNVINTMRTDGWIQHFKKKRDV